MFPTMLYVFLQIIPFMKRSICSSPSTATVNKLRYYYKIVYSQVNLDNCVQQTYQISDNLTERAQLQVHVPCILT